MPVDPPPPPPPGAPHHFPPPPIRVIPTHASIRQFSGGETDFSARQFLDLCESAIVNSSITEDHDKIAFIRSRLLPGSRALNLMQSSAFASGDIGVNYEVFKGNFIKIFGGGSKPSIVRQMAHTVESLQKNSSTKPIWDAMIEANQLAVDCVKSLEDALWLPGGCMQKHQVKTAFELFFYLFHISEKNRRSALPLAFKPSGKLVDFVSELEVKVQEHPHHQPLAPAAALQAQSKASLTCSFCKQSGHSEHSCFAKRRESTHSRQGSDRRSGAYRGGHHSSHRNPRPNHQRKAAFCHIHGNCFHDSDSCSAIQKAKEVQKYKSSADSKPHSSSQNKKT
ncbi:uncharacterized protein LOC127002464 [Eriocheir sinensis]|uniref:uncharacterized protein LOC127002464 n=1 Tax=Eriocheir sinensis TaxID=95602 RepID=UPI0021C6A088|nr:uncharacterized protein LOC127002464 [Eriocheir sinensis]